MSKSKTEAAPSYGHNRAAPERDGVYIFDELVIGDFKDEYRTVRDAKLAQAREDNVKSMMARVAAQIVTPKERNGVYIFDELVIGEDRSGEERLDTARREMPAKEFVAKFESVGPGSYRRRE